MTQEIKPNGGDDFARKAEEAQPGILREFWEFLGEYRKWWLAPILVIVLLLGVFVLLASTGAAPFIYTLF